MPEKLTLEEIFQRVSRLNAAIGKRIFGQEELINNVLCCLFSGGHVLMTGAPGLAKTALVRVISQQLGLASNRIQFTPDLLPSDIIGTDILNIDPSSGQRAFEFSRGPVFTNLLLADEINRASPRTQSALLEAMQERACTVGGKGHKLPYPFMVFATQNPFDSEGTFPLPEAQLDRFLAHIDVDYPTLESENRILQEHVSSRLVGEQLGEISDATSMDSETVCGIIEKARSLTIDEKLVSAIVELIRSTRPSDELCPADLKESIWFGAGPRAGISLISMSRTSALLAGNEVVRWKHIRAMVKIVLGHRIRLSVQALRDKKNETSIIEDLLDRLENRYRHLAQGIE